MRKTMLSTAALALLFGIGTAVAQQSSGERQSGGQARGAGEQSQAQAPRQPFYDAATNRMQQLPQQSGEGSGRAQEGQQQPRQGARAQAPQGAEPRAQAQQGQQSGQGARAQAPRQGGEPRAQAQEGQQRGQGAQAADQRQPDAQPPRTTGRAAQDGARAPRQGERQLERGARETTGQASQEAPRGAQAQRRSAAQEGAQATADARSTSGVSLNEQQRTRISSAIGRQNVRPLSRVNFDVSVGTVVPRSVKLQPLSAEIVSIAPQFRGHRFFVVEDEIVIVEPSSLRIAAIIPRRVASVPATTRAQATTTSRVQLTRQQRESIRTHALRDSPRIATQERVVVGAPVPSSIELRTFPATIVTDIPTMQPLRYFVTDEDVVLVDPAASRVVEVIR